MRKSATLFCLGNQAKEKVRGSETNGDRKTEGSGVKVYDQGGAPCAALVVKRPRPSLHPLGFAAGLVEFIGYKTGFAGPSDPYAWWYRKDRIAP